MKSVKCISSGGLDNKAIFKTMFKKGVTEICQAVFKKEEKEMAVRLMKDETQCRGKCLSSKNHNISHLSFLLMNKKLVIVNIDYQHKIILRVICQTRRDF